ncbi:phosphatidylserine/phosphatidylglycerophosphate/cardiolipin synthase family protein [Pelomonas sp. Root1217]|uniref:phospholipase D-like domain-containing protein n=1 Tax=Pelomonas sp. Root1217 TaxID=1736430 RepID=UPI000A8EFBD6|nr:phospholipase D-like domain-containing protein [Pelomonas sp. Root1217]
MNKGTMASHLAVALATALLTLLGVLVYQNLAGREQKIEQQLPKLYETDDAEFRRALGALLGPQIVEGNQVDTLLNGDEIFPAMLAAIRSARKTITFETYIYWSGSIGREFVEALTERARAGVKVHVLLDWVGSIKMDAALLDEMKAGGVECERFHEPNWANWGQLNNRTHRKLLVVDGRVGFTGGVGIADQWRGKARNKNEWRDTHYRVEGPVVAQMQSVFLDNWMRATGKVLHGENYFPALQPAGPYAAQMFSSSPSGGSESMELMYLLAITAARKSIDLANSYFVPDALTVKTLIDAAKRGVKIRVVTPSEHIDSEAVRLASRSDWGPMLEAGIEFAEYQPTMFHVKGIVVDGVFSSVGSTNFDNRSFRLNDEANLNVLSADFGRIQQQVFEADWAKARRITLDEWRHRPWTEKLLEQAARLLHTQL